jgi:FkbM family methyltransferase
MRVKSLRGKWMQLCHARPSLWASFISGWLKRRENGFVPCAVSGASTLLKVPLKDFYESYFFFCEMSEGIGEVGVFLKNLRPSGEVFYDIGAFRGVYSAMAKTKLQEQIAVHTFEPIPGNFEAIRAILNLNGFKNIALNPTAVGDGTSVVGDFNENDVMLRLGDSNASKGRQFQAIRLDDYIARGNPAPTIIKIDVDGFEFQVLNGAQQCLSKHRPRIWMEVHPAYLRSQGKSSEDILGILRSVGYAITFAEDYSPQTDAPFHIWCQ